MKVLIRRKISPFSFILLLGLATLIITPVSAQVGWYAVPNLPVSPEGYGVAFADSNNAVSVGAVGKMLLSTNAGQSWVLLPQVTQNFLRAVSFRDGLGVAVGDNGTVLHSGDGGATWQVRPAGSTHDLFGVSFLSPQTVIAVGGSGTIICSQDGGLTWSSRNSGSRDELRAVSFRDGTNGVAAGGFLNGVILRTTDGGTTWAQVSVGVIEVLYSVSLSDGQAGLATGLSGTILVTMDGGVSWQAQTLASGGNLFGSHCLDAQTMAVSGTGIHLTTDGGLTWVRQFGTGAYSISYLTRSIALASGPSGILRTTTGGRIGWARKESGTSSALNSVVLRGNIAVSVGDQGTIVRSSDNGEAWSIRPAGTNFALRGVSLSAVSGIAVGDSGTILRSSDDGMTWMSQVSGTTISLKSVCFAGAGTVIAVGGGTILRSTDDGLSWVGINVPGTSSLASVSFGNSTHGITVGNNGPLSPARVLRTSDGGATWIDTTFSVGVVGLLRGVSLTSSGAGFVAAGNGKFLKTVDFGAAWTIGTNLGFNPTGVQCLSERMATLVGGRIIRTTDGGSSWEIQPTPPGQPPYSIVGVAFINDSSGMAVGGFGSILKTTTGGTITSVLESDVQIPEFLQLAQNFPNPFNPSTTILFSLPEAAYVDLKVYNMLGQEAATLVAEEMSAGTQSVRWNAAGFPTGVYFYRLNVEGVAVTKKLLLLK